MWGTGKDAYGRRRREDIVEGGIWEAGLPTITVSVGNFYKGARVKVVG
jgi:hypothetical protein